MFENVSRRLTVGFDQAMFQDPFIDPSRWVVKTGAANRFGTSVTWVDAQTLRLDTAPQMGAVSPVEGVYSGELSIPNVRSLAGAPGGVPLVDQTFAVVIT